MSSRFHPQRGDDSRPAVLIVEDEVLVRLATADSLRSLGFRIIEAADAEEALALIRGGLQASLVFSDVRMPGKTDGVALARLLRSRDPKIRIVMTSGQAPSEAAREVADAFIAKPYDCNRVARILNGLIEAQCESASTVAA